MEYALPDSLLLLAKTQFSFVPQKVSTHPSERILGPLSSQAQTLQPTCLSLFVVRMLPLAVPTLLLRWLFSRSAVAARSECSAALILAPIISLELGLGRS